MDTSPAPPPANHDLWAILPTAMPPLACNEPQRTIVLLGASNLTRGISTAVETLRLMHGSPLRIVAALGHGRSFGLRSSVMGRSLCSTLDCGMWNALDPPLPSGEGLGVRAESAEGNTSESHAAAALTPALSQREREHAPVFALITDIGNDVMYGATPQQIIDWIGTSVDRLARLGTPRINITALPIDSIHRVTPWQFAIVKAMLFPTRDVTFEQAVSRALETQHLLERFVRESSHAERLQMIQHERDWYGFDPIHIKWKHWPKAWARFLTRDDDEARLRADRSFTRWRRLRLHMPAEYQLLGFARSRHQPLILRDGTTVALY
jgi:hypothetical protein